VQIVAHSKGISGEVDQNEGGEVMLHFETDAVSSKTEQELQELLQAVIEAVRIVLALKAIL